MKNKEGQSDNSERLKKAAAAAKEDDIGSKDEKSLGPQETLGNTAMEDKEAAEKLTKS